MRSIIKYPGSKWRMAEYIISLFPEHHSYLEPYFGSGAVLFNKPRSNIETVNDLDGNVVNFFECVREDPEKLAHMIYFTPYSREVYDKACDTIADDKYERALNFCASLNMGHGFRTGGYKSGWKNDVQGRERAYAAKDWCSLPERIIEAAERLRGVQIENRDALDVIKRFQHSNVLIYCDPPYLLETRRGEQYKKEMSDKDHEELLDVLQKHPGPVMLSGYASELYDSVLKDWHREVKGSYTQSGNKKQEVLWMNFEPVEQIKLF